MLPGRPFTTQSESTVLWLNVSVSDLVDSHIWMLKDDWWTEDVKGLNEEVFVASGLVIVHSSKYYKFVP